LIATSILGVIAQRLIRVLCPHCKVKHEPSDFQLNSIGITREMALRSNIHKAIGCANCNQKGYIGRTTIAEVMVMNDEVRSLIMQRKDGNSIRRLAVANGMKTFRDHGIQKVLAGITTIEELLTNTQLDL
jgi:general secretion pathway protein E